MTARRRRLWWITTAGYAGLVFLFSVVPTSGELGPKHVDKVQHVGTYLVFTWLLVQAIRISRPPAGEARLISLYLRWAWIYAFSYGLLMEVLQLFLPWRGTSGWDVLMNGVGAALGVWVARRWPRPQL